MSIWKLTKWLGVPFLVAWSALNIIGNLDVAQTIASKQSPTVKAIIALSSAAPWWIPTGILLLCILVMLCLRFDIFPHERAELEPFSTKIARINDGLRLSIGVKNTQHIKAIDTQITATFWRCSRKHKPLAIRKTIANPISREAPHEIDLELTIAPLEPLFFVISFAYRIRERGRIKTQKPSFYYRWNVSDSSLVHASGEERDIIRCRLKQGDISPPRVATESQESTQSDSHPKRKEVLDKAIGWMQGEKKRLQVARSSLKVDTLSALVISRADQLETEEDLVWVCDKIAVSHSHPFDTFNRLDHSPVLKGEWLEFLQAYWESAPTDYTTTAVFTFATKFWRGKDRWLKRPKPEPRTLDQLGIEQVEENPFPLPTKKQKLESNLNTTEKYDLLDGFVKDADSMLGHFFEGQPPYPTEKEFNEWSNRLIEFAGEHAKIDERNRLRKCFPWELKDDEALQKIDAPYPLPAFIDSLLIRRKIAKQIMNRFRQEQ